MFFGTLTIGCDPVLVFDRVDKSITTKRCMRARDRKNLLYDSHGTAEKINRFEEFRARDKTANHMCFLSWSPGKCLVGDVSLWV